MRAARTRSRWASTRPTRSCATPSGTAWRCSVPCVNASRRDLHAGAAERRCGPGRAPAAGLARRPVDARDARSACATCAGWRTALLDRIDEARAEGADPRGGSATSRTSPAARAHRSTRSSRSRPPGRSRASASSAGRRCGPRARSATRSPARCRASSRAPRRPRSRAWTRSRRPRPTSGPPASPANRHPTEFAREQLTARGRRHVGRPARAARTTPSSRSAAWSRTASGPRPRAASRSSTSRTRPVS